MAVTVSQVFVVRRRASSSIGIAAVALRPDEHELVVDADRWTGDVGHVGHHRVHRDVPDERDADAPDEGLGPVRDGAREAVAVAERAASRSGSAGSC